MKECCKHSVFVEENNRLEAIPTAMQHLTLEAGGQEAEVIVCNEQNMPLNYHTIIGSDGIHMEDENPWLWMAIGTIIAATICWQLIS
tara:strand:- start:15 stop:275 length:261 start_codon:yes stop_codon:yes gene_type:complete